MSVIDTIRDRPKQTLLALIILVIAGVMFYDWIVISEEERIEAMLQTARDQFIAGQVEPFLGNFDSSFSSTVTTLKDLERRCQARAVADATVTLSRVDFDENDTSRARARIRVASRREGGRVDRTMIQLELRKPGERWLILGAKLWGSGM